MANSAAEEVWGFLFQMGNCFSIFAFLYTTLSAISYVDGVILNWFYNQRNSKGLSSSKTVSLKQPLGRSSPKVPFLVPQRISTRHPTTDSVPVPIPSVEYQSEETNQPDSAIVHLNIPKPQNSEVQNPTITLYPAFSLPTPLQRSLPTYQISTC